MMTPIRDLKKCKMFITDGDVEKGLHLIVKEWVTVSELPTFLTFGAPNSRTL